ncbi:MULTISPECIES: endolytic transglycosylase MltG [unclassified Yoonia]|uniref:endolytic transglycosylase MltG n=1 Tax=unclassified Yoonia TaxID=2629118 RepID=UPI002AFE0056|nr:MULTISPECIES: endolytic transglycosylase MltG [unclassified Yoonia]
MWRNIASNALTLFVVALFLLAGAIGWASKAYRDPGPLAQAICFEVPAGASMNAVADRLSEQDAVTSRMILRAGADYTDKSGLLKAGSFLVPERASMEEIVDIITRGGANTCGTEVIYRIGVNQVQGVVRDLDPVTNRFVELVTFDPVAGEEPAEYIEVRDQADTRYRLILAEGVTSWQVLNALQNIATIDADVTERPAEGRLAPGSYDLTPGTAASAILAQMTSRQDQIIATAWANRDEDLPLANPEEMLILASIIEKETGIGGERAQVASVFVNRLRQGMRLQTDPTVIYGITEGEGVLGRGIRQSELQAETPWNTYVITGLPPTPIANPGRESIEAAVNPDETDYIFFVADGTGGHTFTTNLDDHNRAVAVWRQIEAERAANPPAAAE